MNQEQKKHLKDTKEALAEATKFLRAGLLFNAAFQLDRLVKSAKALEDESAAELDRVLSKA